MIFCKLKDMKQNVITLAGFSFYNLNHLGKYISEAHFQGQQKKNVHVVTCGVGQNLSIYNRTVATCSLVAEGKQRRGCSKIAWQRMVEKEMKQMGKQGWDGHGKGPAGGRIMLLH